MKTIAENIIEVLETYQSTIQAFVAAVRQVAKDRPTEEDGQAQLLGQLESVFSADKLLQDIFRKGID